MTLKATAVLETYYALRAAMHPRKIAMVKALGFTNALMPYGADYEAMYAWNDAQTNPDAIKHRIKEAINEI